MTTQTQPVVDEAKLNAFMMKAVGDMGAAAVCSTILLGQKLGLYGALAGAGPVTPAELAKKTKTNERLVTEWLNAQAAGGYVTYANGKYELPAEHAMALANEDSPVFIGGAFDVVAAMFASDEKLAEGFRNGKGLGWKDQHPRLFGGTERFFRPGYRAFLTTAWIPALEGVEVKLKAGAKVADVGCGHGVSTIIMGQTYPNSTFIGFDYHDGSIKMARERAKEAGARDNVKFETKDAKSYPTDGFDLICFFDCLHDMGDPIGAAKHARKALKDDGTVLLIEPMAGNSVEENLASPISPMFYAASTMLCTANALSQGGDPVLGAQAGEKQLGDVMKEAGFSHFRRATDTPFNLVLEARP
ncbi:MAG: methyltransferase domain-containing protein [Chloroflexota bacterium]|nr:methyltransferase domain-containing protein [Chloroflexota bacterium]